MVRIETPAESTRDHFLRINSGFIGVETGIAPEKVPLRFGLADGFVKSLSILDFIVMTSRGLGCLFAAEIDVRLNLSGPSASPN
jgi:hypothetical protein